MNNLLLLICVLWALTACKKQNSDGVGPQVTWNSPAENALIYSVDTIVVNAHITDDEVVRRVKVSLTNAAGSSLANMGDEFPGTPTYQLNKAFYINRPDLQGGQPYYLNLIAYDNDNHTSIFRKINLVPLPLEEKAVMVAYGAGNNRTVALLENGVMNPVLSGAGDVQRLVPNHLEGNVKVVSTVNGKIRALNYPEFGQQWEHDIPNNTSWRSIESVSLNPNNGELLVGDTDHFFQILNKSGSVIAGFDTELLLHRPVTCLLTDNRAFAIERRIDNSSQDFTVFFKVSGAVEFRIGMQGDVVEMFPDVSSENITEPNQTVIFVNENGQPRIRKYNIMGQNFTQIGTLPQGEITAVCKLANRRYLFQIDGTVYRFNFAGPLQVFYNGPDFHRLVHDPLGNRVFGLTQSHIHVFSLQGNGMQEIGTIAVNNPRDVCVLYNRNP
ncbi:MAG: hypothetical protein EA392_09695 [Cryomorphaceae bacterium]|nr:MAG: hypothetical protein EA392_09695 [Cryomorphaceae bacterium]